MTLNNQSGPSGSNSYFYHSDGNGNVTMLINGHQAIVAKYLYDAFGNTISRSGLLADGNLYRFAGKEAHPNSSLIYYLYRYYDPNLQRWPNRDPLAMAVTPRNSYSIESIGQLFIIPTKVAIPFDMWNWIGPNLYRPAENNPVSNVDPFGLWTISVGLSINFQ